MAEVIDALELIGPTAFGSSEEYARYRETLEALRDEEAPADATGDTGQSAPAYPYPGA